MNRVKLNFVIPNDLDDDLVAYCGQTGRTPGDVVRQLLVEWLEGDRHLVGPVAHPAGKRTQTSLSPAARAALVARIAREGLGTIAAVTAALLRPFLAHRARPTGSAERTMIPVTVSADLATKFLVFGERWNWSPSDCVRILAEDPTAFDRLLSYALARGGT